MSPRSRTRKGKKRSTQDNARIIEADTPIKITESAPLQQSRNHSVSNPQSKPQSEPLMAQAASARAVSQPLPPKPIPTQSEPAKPSIKWEMPAEALEDLEKTRRSHRSHQVCPHCGATDTERRRRKMWEKVAFAFTSMRAYKCRICGSDFYARRKPKAAE